MFVSPPIHHAQQWLNGELRVSHSTLLRTSVHWFCVPLAVSGNKMSSGNL